MATQSKPNPKSKSEKTTDNLPQPDGKPGDQIDKNVPRDQDPEIGHAPRPDTVDPHAENDRLVREDRERFEQQGSKVPQANKSPEA